MNLADLLADQLGHVRIQQEQLGILAHHLLAAIDAAHTLEQGPESSTATPTGSAIRAGAVAVDTPDRTQQDTATLHDPPLPDPVSADDVAFSMESEPLPPAAKKSSKYALDLVAVIAREAIELGISPKKHVHDLVAVCPTEAMAHTLIAQARKAGHDIPMIRAARTPAPPRTGPTATGEEQVPGKHFQCTAIPCGHSTGTVREMQRHTRSAHNRDAYVHERTPT